MEETRFEKGHEADNARVVDGWQGMKREVAREVENGVGWTKFLAVACFIVAGVNAINAIGMAAYNGKSGMVVSGEYVNGAGVGIRAALGLVVAVVALCLGLYLLGAGKHLRAFAREGEEKELLATARLQEQFWQWLGVGVMAWLVLKGLVYVFK
jgi:hypothetical protein